MSEHTKEPWLVDGDYLVTEGGSRIAVFTHYADVKRVKACVDACAGMDDPVGDIKSLRTQLQNWKDFSAKVQRQSAGLSESNENWMDGFNSMKQQRDELLAALKDISNTALGHPYAGVTCGEIARDAIAKVESEK